MEVYGTSRLRARRPHVPRPREKSSFGAAYRALSPQLSQRLIRLKKGGEQEESSVEVTLYATRESSSTRMRRIEGTFTSMSIHVYNGDSCSIPVHAHVHVMLLRRGEER